MYQPYGLVLHVLLLGWDMYAQRSSVNHDSFDTQVKTTRQTAVRHPIIWRDVAGGNVVSISSPPAVGKSQSSGRSELKQL